MRFIQKQGATHIVEYRHARETVCLIDVERGEVTDSVFEDRTLCPFCVRDAREGGNHTKQLLASHVISGGEA